MTQRIFSFTLATLLLAGCSDMRESEPVVQAIETPTGTVVTETTVADPVPQTITVVTGEELLKLRSLPLHSLEFLHAHAGQDAAPTLEAYDAAFTAWQASPSPSHSAGQVTELLGGVLGNRCVDGLDMEWVTVTDQYGTDYAVRSRRTQVMAFPFSSVMKRIEARDSGFMAGVYEVTKHTLESKK